MKKFNIFFILSILAISLNVSCEDELDVQPEDSLTTDSFFNTTQDFRLALDGMYAQLLTDDDVAVIGDTYYGSVSLSGLPDILSDNVILVQTGRLSNRNNFEFNYTSLNNIGPFNEAYEIINLANIIIERIDNIPDGDDKNDILGQTLAMRAFAHFDMARLYAQIPTQDPGSNGTLGIPYLKFEDGDTGDAFAQPSRDTVGENYQDIVADLLQARGLIATDNGSGRFNRDAVNAFLSRVYLYMGEWQNSIDAGNLVTTDLASIDNYSAIFTDDTTEGVIMLADQDPALDNVTVGVLWSQTASGNVISEYALDFEFFNSISDDDVRKGVLTVIGNNDGVEHNAVNKVGINVNGVVDVKLFRAAEVWLNRAEAQFNLNNEGAALATLNELRAVRYSANAPSGESGQALEDAIQFERRVELAFESHRFFDIKRRGESVQRSNFGDLSDGTGTPADVQTLPAGDFRFQIPFPLAEINNNPNFEQNPGY
ncbi:MAG: RagB/SusD family nutrient uptake outer membrane protein [Bacteroidota bacterium]